MFGLQIGQRSKALLLGVFVKQKKRILAGLVAAGCLHVGLVSEVEAHWWNRCYSRAHYVLPSHCGWHHYGLQQLLVSFVRTLVQFWTRLLSLGSSLPSVVPTDCLSTCFLSSRLSSHTGFLA